MLWLIVQVRTDEVKVQVALWQGTKEDILNQWQIQGTLDLLVLHVFDEMPPLKLLMAKPTLLQSVQIKSSDGFEVLPSSNLIKRTVRHLFCVKVEAVVVFADAIDSRLSAQDTVHTFHYCGPLQKAIGSYTLVLYADEKKIRNVDSDDCLPG